MRLAVASKIGNCVLFYQFNTNAPFDSWELSNQWYARWKIDSPVGLATDSKGDLYVVSAGSPGGPHYVYRMAKHDIPSPTGNQVVIAASNHILNLYDGSNALPLDLAFDVTDRMYIAWVGGINSKIRIFDSSKKELSPIAEDVSDPVALCTSGTGDRVFAACFDGILVIDSQLKSTLYAVRRGTAYCPSATCGPLAGVCGLVWDEVHGKLYAAVGVAQNFGRDFNRLIECSWTVDKAQMTYEYSGYSSGTSGNGTFYPDWHLAPGKMVLVNTDANVKEIWACVPTANILSHLAPSGILRVRGEANTAAFVLEARTWVKGHLSLPFAFVVLPEGS